MNLALYFDFHTWLAGALLGTARLAPVFFMLPFLNSGVLTGTPRMVVLVLLGLAFWLYSGVPLPEASATGYLRAAFQEVGIGMAVGCVLCWPFWVMHAVGNLIDNQRGAMLSNVVDPANGNDSSELANFLQLFSAMIYLEAGGMELVVGTLAHSYQLCAPGAGCHVSLTTLHGLLDAIVVKSVLVSAPVVAALLVVEALLGLLARFAPQMNAFSVSLTVKGFIAFGVLFVYLGAYVPEEVQRMGQRAWELPAWLDRPEVTE
ncbi:MULTISPECIES: type III secretion system export apparatus subunit SctT [Pseudomonas]|uniref:SpaR/YscT/HrcT type III secretion system export apparatus protein n=1 Tax=Pseudomonas quercus TaxID=2722792 RepID=A0ABX0Y8I0_9PSED|nr:MULTISPECIES: type III secretion system export apparatus subunit SctT [Pseudomonas]MBF7141012.1 SpaR/YscT/HrcT type III secretion system export apparatus protein [Pseudomonas sp. LY10J]NJO99546.1 SpaR/YscT/HrcT type III secretion system export apparatus protein [Pseudomonas quercus]